jgi:hypothetical protein
VLLVGLVISKDIFLKSPDSWWSWRLLQRHLIILLLGAVAAGVYQSFILVYAVLGVALSLWLYCRSEPRHLSNHICRMIYVLSMSVAAIALSMGIGAMILLIMGMQLSQHATYFVRAPRLVLPGSGASRASAMRPAISSPRATAGSLRASIRPS